MTMHEKTTGTSYTVGHDEVDRAPLALAASLDATAPWPARTGSCCELVVQLTEPYDSGSWVFWRSRS